MSGPCVIFDVVGTCCKFRDSFLALFRLTSLVGYDSVVDSLKDVFASQKASKGSSIQPELFFSAWTSNAEVNFQYLSVLEKFHSHADLLKKAFYKTMQDAGIPESSVAEADVDLLLAQYSHNLTPRPGLSEMIQTLRDEGFTIWCCSDATPERVRVYFENAGIDMPIANLLSCNMCKAAKPDPKVYQMVKQKLGLTDVTVFAAAHAWDLAGARKEGFNTAYCTVCEDQSSVDLFGEANVVADTLPKLASAIVQKWGKESKL
ncbi:putative 2-haloalkanoic acid dehalogenase [Mycena galopus ATCC 62051]|nr:putative 2-haloalkanoic acid dehalogenase [Mycena galopus ATCC 62051]